MFYCIFIGYYGTFSLFVYSAVWTHTAMKAAQLSSIWRNQHFTSSALKQLPVGLSKGNKLGRSHQISYVCNSVSNLWCNFEAFKELHDGIFGEWVCGVGTGIYYLRLHTSSLDYVFAVFKKIQFFSIDPLNAKQQWTLPELGCQILSLSFIWKMQQQTCLHLLLQKASGNPSASGCQFSAIYLLFAKQKTNKQKSYGHFPLSLFRKMQQYVFMAPGCQVLFLYL